VYGNENVNVNDEEGIVYGNENMNVNDEDTGQKDT
jgi:hypothetical protein